jgi:hypothetical protein
MILRHHPTRAQRAAVIDDVVLRVTPLPYPLGKDAFHQGFHCPGGMGGGKHIRWKAMEG